MFGTCKSDSDLYSRIEFNKKSRIHKTYRPAFTIAYEPFIIDTRPIALPPSSNLQGGP